MLTTRHPVDFAYTTQELQALFRYAHDHDVEQGGRYDARSAAINVWSHHWLNDATQEASETIGTFYVHWEPPVLWEIETDEGFQPGGPHERARPIGAQRLGPGEAWRCAAGTRGSLMTDKTTLHQLIEELPESEWLAAERFLAYLRDMADPVRRALLTAPWDDEPETDKERQAVQEAYEELARGDTIPDADLWRRLGHEPRP